MAALAKPAKRSKTGKSVFIIMSFNPTLDFLYRDALIPAATDCDLQPYRVDKEEFDGTITEAILDKIRNCRLVVADLTDERPNCFFELGYALALGKPAVLTARKDHDSRRDSRRPDDPKVHFDLDSHKITYWVRDDMNQLRRQLAARIRKHL
jgi:nucleoside 2-deoxyribosyltransferase